MVSDPFEKQLDRGLADHDVAAQFKGERLANRALTKSQWPAVVDNAALDLVYGIALGHTQSRTDIGGTIDSITFPEATGGFYQEGLRALAGSREGTTSAVQQFDGEDLAKFAYRLTKFREDLRGTDRPVDIDRGIEALVEKLSTDALDDGDSVAEFGLGSKLRHRSSASDLILQLLADPEITDFGQRLFELVNHEVQTDSLAQQLDRPRMTTVLWEHQREALREWVEGGRVGYVDMATATGKTVLGLAAIAIEFGELHPHDHDLVLGTTDPEDVRSDADAPDVLIVAGNQVLLQQWHRQFDEHLDIPKERTIPEQSGASYRVSLNWGETANIEFQTAQALAARDVIGSYDLVILDEAHQYARGGREARRWRDVFDDLAERSDSILAMSGSIQTGWQGDPAAREALEQHLELCYQYGLEEAREDGVIAEFDWEVRYAPTPIEDAEKVATHTRILDKYLDLETGKLRTDELGIELGDQPNEFPSHRSLRSFVQTESGSRLRSRSNEFDFLSTALLTRRTTQWNQSVTFESIAGVLARHADEKCVVLVQSYEEATALRDYLSDANGRDTELIALHGRDDDPDEKIQRFNDVDGGVLIGPGRLLGTGVDLPDAEVAVNIAQGNVSATLVQRIGRVLRNPSGEKHATFYHLVPQPTPSEAVIPREDGYQLLVQKADFETLGASIDKRPQFSVGTEAVGATVDLFETAGADQLESFPQLFGDASGPEAQDRLEDLVDRITTSSADRGALAGPNEKPEGVGAVPSGATGAPVGDSHPSDLTEDDLIELEWLERVALNETNDPQACEIRLAAVDRLSAFGPPAEEGLRRVADEERVTEEQIREAARERLRELGGA